MIADIDVRPAVVDMDVPFVHAGKRRMRTASVLVTLATADGVYGWGEGAPRAYVTGETLDSVRAVLAAVTPELLDGWIDLREPGQALRQLAGLDLVRRLGRSVPCPAASAALELALFDLICRRHNLPGVVALRQAPAAAPLVDAVPSPVPVSLVLDLAGDVSARLAGLPADTRAAVRHVKLKGNADLDETVRRVACTREAFGAEVGISVDVNGDWDCRSAVRAATLLRPYRLAWLEEPVAARDWDAMRAVQLDGGVPVMLDESCSSQADLDAAAAAEAATYVNARVSKCGGIFPTLALIAATRERGLGAQLGVHVGEVGPLWAAARLIACTVRPLAAVEAGRQDEWFGVPLTDPPYDVDRRHYLAHPLGGVGLGVVPCPNWGISLAAPFRSDCEEIL